MLHLKRLISIKLDLKINLGLLLVFKNQYILNKFIYKNDPQSKAIFHEQYKTYRNLLFTLMKQSKQLCYAKYFESN